MSEAPERIWAVTEPNDISADTLGDVYAQQVPDGMVGTPVEYIRADRIKELAARAEAAEAKLAKWEDATTPSDDTKRAYMGEFTFSIEMYHPGGDSEHRQVSVPWTVIKDIMRAISARAKGQDDG